MKEGKKTNHMEERQQEIEAVEASVKCMKDFTSPEQLYDELIRSILSTFTFCLCFALFQAMQGFFQHTCSAI